MSKTTLKEILDILNEKNNFLIVFHEKPDGDAVGASVSLALFLKAINKECAVLSPDKIPDRLAFAKPDSARLFEGARALNDSDYKYEYVISVDVASPELISSALPCLKNNIDMAIDHHRVNTIQASIKYVDEKSAAAGEIIYNLITEYEKSSKTKIIDKAIATSLFISISSDTGCFKYGNTTSNSHKIASALLKSDVNSEEINRLLFDTKTASQIRAEQLGYKNMKMFFDDRLAITCIQVKDFQKYKISEEDTETISQQARMILGVQIGVFMREKKFSDGRTGYKFSVRSNVDSDVSDLCSKFGGGGHKKAAGCTIYSSKNKALTAFLQEAEKYLI